MNKDLFDRIVHQLLSQMTDPAARKAQIESALYGSPLLHQLQWDGAAHPFTVRIIRQLHDYGDVAPGQPAVVTLLEEVKHQVGLERQTQINHLIQEYLFQTQGGKTPMPLENAVLIGFLLEVGRWAKNELSERWKLRREQQETDLTDRAQVEQLIPEQIQSIVSEKSSREVERIVALIERRRDAIYRARQAKLADREEFGQQRLIKSAFEQRETEHNKTIQLMLDEIEADLTDLGFDVEREPA